MGEPSFRFSIPSFVRRGQGEVAASHGHGRPNVPLVITLRTKSKTLPHLNPPLTKGRTR